MKDTARKPPSIQVWFRGHLFVRDHNIDDMRCARCEVIIPQHLKSIRACPVQVH